MRFRGGGTAQFEALAAEFDTHRDDLANHSSGRELAYAETTTTFASASLAAGAYEDVAPASVVVAINFTAGARPVVLEAGAYTWQAGTVGGRPEFVIANSANVVHARHRYVSSLSGSNILYMGPRASRRLQLVEGSSYSFKLRVGNATGASASSAVSVFAAADSPIFLQAREV